MPISDQQLASKPCCICNGEIDIWELARCPECRTQFHGSCLNQTNGICPPCRDNNRTLWKFALEGEEHSWKHPDLIRSEEMNESWSLDKIEEEIRRMVLSISGAKGTWTLRCHTGADQSGVPGAFMEAMERADPTHQSSVLFYDLVKATHHAVKRERGKAISGFSIAIDDKKISFEYGDAQ